MRRLLLAMVAIGGCDEGATTTTAETSARIPAVVDVPANVRLPVVLPTIDPKQTRPMVEVPTFIALTSRGETSAGMLSPGLQARRGAAVAIDQIGATLTKLLGVAAVEGAPERSAHGSLTDGRADTLLLADGSARSKDLISVLQQASPRAVAIAVKGDRLARLPYLWSPATIQAAPIHIEVTEYGLTLYGASIAWGDVESEMTKLVESQRKATSMSLLAALTVHPGVDVQNLVTMLGALAAAGVDEVRLTVDITASPQPVATTSNRDGGIPTVSIGQPSASGDLDKAIIRRYIKRNIQKLTYCYEKELLGTPGLQGTVATTFTITASGTVREARGTGVHPSVAACIANVIGNIEFPKPKDGGVVRVNYPFTFRPGGG